MCFVFFFADRGPATQNKMNLTKTQKCSISLRKSGLVVLPNRTPRKKGPKKYKNRESAVAVVIFCLRRNMRNFMTYLNLDMSGPAKASPEGEVRVSKVGFYYFLRHYILPCLLTNL